MGKKNQSQKTYAVQEILDIKINEETGDQMFKVKWQGFNIRFATWEPIEAFLSDLNVLDQFLQSRAQKDPIFKQKLEKIQNKKIENESVQNNKIKNKEVESKKIENEAVESFKIKNKEVEGKTIENEVIPGKSEQKTKQIKKQKKKYSPGLEISENLIQLKKSIDFEETDPKQNQKPKINIQTENVEKKEQEIYKQTQLNQNNQKIVLETTKQTTKISNEKKVLIQSPEKLGQTVDKQPKFDERSKKGVYSTKISFSMIKREKNSLKFYCTLNGEKVWLERQQVHQKFSRELCEFYEKHLSFDH